MFCSYRIRCIPLPCLQSNVLFQPKQQPHAGTHQQPRFCSKPCLSLKLVKKLSSLRTTQIYCSPSPALHRHESDPEEEPPLSKPLTIFGRQILNFESISYLISITYFITLFMSVLTGNPYLFPLARFENFALAMCIISSSFTAYYFFRWFNDVRYHVASKEEKKRHFQGTLTFAWRAMFWLAFIYWYTASPASPQWAEALATPGVIMSLYGLALAASSALMTGQWSFLAEPARAPRVLITWGPYALLRHPQTLGNMLFLIGFSLAGGAYLSSMAFVCAFFLYRVAVIPKEERMLQQAFGVKYTHYRQRVPAFAWALILLLVAEAVLIWKYGSQYAIPIDT